MKLTNNRDRLQQEYGLDPLTQMLFSQIRLDSYPFVLPLIAELNGEQILLVRQQEYGNVLSQGLDLSKVKFYEPWVNIDERVLAGKHAYPNLASLVKELSSGADVELDGTMPLTHKQKLESEVRLTTTAVESGAVRVFALNRDEVVSQFREWRRQGASYIPRLQQDFAPLSGALEGYNPDLDTRFSGLEALAAEQEVQAYHLDSPPNFSEVTGFAHRAGLSALFIVGDERIYVLADEADFGVPGTPLGHFASREQAITQLLGNSVKSLGVEEQWTPIATAEVLERQYQLINASVRLGHWRDIRDREELPFVVLVARASTHAIEGALARAQEELDRGQSLNETILYDYYLEALHEFRAQHQMPFAIEPYFVNLTASTRMLFPGPPVDHEINPETNCFQIDSGVKLTINGVILSTSDMARSALRNEAAQRGYDVLTNIIRDEMIPAIRPGVRMDSIHELAVNAIERERTKLEDAGILGAGVDFASPYRKRNVGHLMGKQESFANELRPGYHHVLEVGDYGAAELPWRFGTYSIATEDMWFIGEDQTYLLTY